MVEVKQEVAKMMKATQTGKGVLTLLLLILQVWQIIIVMEELKTPGLSI